MAAQAQDKQTIFQQIDAHMQKSGYSNSQWYVGITSDIDERLFGYHQVPKKDHWYIWKRAFNDGDAREIESAYHRAGCQGSGGGGDTGAVFVYAYVITNVTVE
jgi:hypothetical protein